ncbi:MAG TPA: DUF4255 domain-containing protein [Chitinophagaceae bacterium]|jgi:hypothetical protein|nr:DUF4255 domain-containing protein [Chitinophagaceae bacterium]
MIESLFKELGVKFNGFLRLNGFNALFRAAVGDVSIHDKSVEGGVEEELSDSILISLVSIEEDPVLKNNYPLQQVGASFLKQKSAIYINIYVLFAAKYKTYDVALEAISHVISFFQSNKRFPFTVDGTEQEAVLSLHNIGFENLNNLWTVLGGRYLPSVIYKARVLLFQAAPPVGGPAIVEIREKEPLV